MEYTLTECIAQALSKARAENGTRENALTITKLQEALMWHNEHQKVLIEAARRVQQPVAPVMTDPAKQ